MITDRKLPILNHLTSFQRCYEANERCLNKKQRKKIYKLIIKIRKALK